MLQGPTTDLVTHAPAVQLAVPAVRTATVTGTGIDCQDYEGTMFGVQQVGTVSGTTPTLDGKFQDSADDSTYADITGATFTQVTTSTSVQTIRLLRTKRYVRYVGTIGGTTPSFACSAALIPPKKSRST